MLIHPTSNISDCRAEIGQVRVTKFTQCGLFFLLPKNNSLKVVAFWKLLNYFLWGVEEV
jgi:hypothetical protein